MAPAAWYSVVHRAVSLDRTPAVFFRPEPPAARVVSVVRRLDAGSGGHALQMRRNLVAVVAAATAKMNDPASDASGEDKGRSFIEEMRAAAMRLHTNDQTREGEKYEPLEPPVAEWKTTVEGYIRFLVDSKLVFCTLEAVVNRASVPWYAEFQNTRMERSEALNNDLEWFRQQGHTIPEPSAAGITYASFLEELSEKEPHAFINHFYNLYFGHAAGGRIIGKKVSETINIQKKLEYYEWENLPQLLQTVRDKFNEVASAWTREEKDRCLDEMEKSFVCSVDLRRHMFS